MSSAIAKLWVELGADTAAFETDMGKAAHVANQKLEGLKDTAGKVGAGIMAGLAIGATAFAALAAQAIDAADELDNLSIRTGVSVEELSRLSYAAQMSDTSMESVAAGTRKLSDNMVAAANGNATARASFDALGVSVTNADGSLRSSDEVMKDVASRFSEMEDGAAKSAAATDIFGKAGTDLIPMLNEGRDGLEAMGNEAERLGLVISSNTAAQAAAFNDNLDKMKLSASGMVTKVTADMLPTFNKLSEQLFKTAQDTDFLKHVSEGLATIFKIVVSAGLGVKAALTAVGEGIGKVAAAVAAVIGGDFTAAKEIMADTSSLDDFKATIGNIKALWDDTAASATAAATAQDAALGKSKAPSYAPGGAKAAKPAGEKGKQFQELGGGWISSGVDAAMADSDDSAAAWEAKEGARIQANIERLRQEQMSKRELEVQDFALKQQQIQEAAAFATITETEKLRMIEEATRQHKERLKVLDDDELARKQQANAQSVAFFQNGLNTIAAGQGKAAKAAQAVTKAQALYKIGIDTRSAAMGAYNALVGIPYVGPALAVAAAGAAMAFGAAQAAAVRSGGGTGGGYSAGASVSPTAAGSVQPVADQRVAEQASKPTQTTIVRVPEDRMMTGRQLLDFLDEALGDGKQLTNLRFLPA